MFYWFVVPEVIRFELLLLWKWPNSTSFTHSRSRSFWLSSFPSLPSIWALARARAHHEHTFVNASSSSSTKMNLITFSSTLTYDVDTMFALCVCVFTEWLSLRCYLLVGCLLLLVRFVWSQNRSLISKVFFLAVRPMKKFNMKTLCDAHWLKTMTKNLCVLGLILWIEILFNFLKCFHLYVFLATKTHILSGWFQLVYSPTLRDSRIAVSVRVCVCVRVCCLLHTARETRWFNATLCVLGI